MTIPIRRGDGPEGARVMIVGEAYGEYEEQQCTPFVGASGQLLNQMLHEAGIMRSECYLTNVVNARPPYNDLTKWLPKQTKSLKMEAEVRGKKCAQVLRDGYESLLGEISLIKPEIIIALGGVAMWALTGQSLILKWRGSQMYSDIFPGLKVIPTVHPAAVLREYSLRQTAVHDLRRAARHRYAGPYQNLPNFNFHIGPSLRMVEDTVSNLLGRCAEGPLWVEFDLETSPIHITNVGISWSKTEALNIPILRANGSNYWSTPEEEGRVIWLLYKLLTHPNCLVRGQNLLYDCQHTYRWWHWVPNVKQDTMISHHTCFSGMKKSLDFQASLYADYYVYWKMMHRDLSNKAGA